MKGPLLDHRQCQLSESDQRPSECAEPTSRGLDSPVPTRTECSRDSARRQVGSEPRNRAGRRLPPQPRADFAESIRRRHAVLQRFCNWARAETAIEGVLLVGSHARGTARSDSDVDLIVLTNYSDEYVGRAGWLQHCGQVLRYAVEDYGAIQSVRAYLVEGGQFEFGFASPSWASTEPVDPGTRRVIQDGAVVVVDKRGRLRRLQETVHRVSDDDTGTPRTVADLRSHPAR